MNDFNHVIVSGTVHKEPESTMQPSGRVVKLLLESRQDFSETKQHTEWYSVVCPPPVSASAVHLVAGRKVMVMGVLRSKDGGQAKSILAHSLQIMF